MKNFAIQRPTLFAVIVLLILEAIVLDALRIRTNTIVPLVLHHALNDFLQFSATGGLEAGDVALYISILKIVLGGLMALYGLYILRGHRDDTSTSE